MVRLSAAELDGKSAKMRRGVPELIVLVAYLAMLAGDTSLRVTEVVTIEVRFVLAYLAICLWVPWRAALRGSLPGGVFRYLSWFMAFATVLMASGLWASAGAEVGALAADLLVIILLVGVVADICVQCPRVLEFLPIVLVLAGVVFLAGAIVGGPVTPGRYAAFGGGANVFVRIEAFGVFSGAYLAVSRGSFVGLVGGPLCFIGVLLSGSRGGLVSLLVASLVVVPLVAGWLRHRGILVRVVLGASILVGIVVAVFYDTLDRIVAQRFSIELFDIQAAGGRDSLYGSAVELFLERPLVGWGLGGFFAEHGHKIGYQYTHNIVLDIAVDAGLLGLAAFSALLIYSLSAVRGSARRDPMVLMFWSLGVFMIGASQFSGTYYDTRYAWLFFGLAWVARSKRVNERPGVVAFGPARAGVIRRSG